MNDNGPPPGDRVDPFGQGLAAHRDKLERGQCPFVGTHVEGRRWLAGWDHAAFKAGEDPVVAGRIGSQIGRARPRAWKREEIVVLTTLANSGERLGSLASRLGRTRSAVRDECERQHLALTEDQLSG